MSTAKSERQPMSKKTADTRKKVVFYLDQHQLERLKQEYKEAGRATMTGYVRERLGLERQAVMVNPVGLLKALDEIGTELTCISRDMNRVAVYVDRLSAREDVDAEPVHRFNLLMDKYMARRRDIVKAYRAVIRKL